MNPLLLIMNPRRIPRCMAAFEALRVDKAYLVAYWEKELEPVIEQLVATNPQYSHFVLLADDTVPTQAALDRVLHWAPKFPVVTGYVNNDVESPLVNLTKTPFRQLDRSVWEDYDWYSRAEVDAWDSEIGHTCFTGASLTTMSRDMWRQFPFRCVTNENEPRGYSSDWHLSRRLQDAGVPIVAVKGGFVEHVKEKANTQAYTDPHKRLLVGEIPSGVRWELNGPRPASVRV